MDIGLWTIVLRFLHSGGNLCAHECEKHTAQRKKFGGVLMVQYYGNRQCRKYGDAFQFPCFDFHFKQLKENAAWSRRMGL